MPAIAHPEAPPASQTNQLIHLLFVPTLLFTAFAMYASTTEIPELLGYEHVDLPFGLRFDGGLVAAAIYMAYYPIVETGGMGLLVAALTGAAYVGGQALYTACDSGALADKLPFGFSALGLATTVHVLSWAAQIFGHQVFEGRAPALLTNLPQSLLMAPLFVSLETAFFFGYRPDFHKSVMKEVVKEVADYKVSKAKAKKRS